MITKETRCQILDLIHKEVVPAIGCTEPMAVALCTARATEMLGCRPEHISLYLSANILKNAMGVGIPGTGMVGLPIAVALGALIGKSEYKLEVLKDLTPEALEEGKKYIAENRIVIQKKTGIEEKLYIEVCCEAGGRSQTAVIAGSHTHFITDEEKEMLSQDSSSSTVAAQPSPIQLTMQMVYEFAMTAPLSEISFILEARDLNMRAAELSVKGNYGHCLGKTIDRPLSHGIFGNSIFSHIISKTASACDARMGGAMIPVMSNSGSGNQGICATNPVAVFATENENTEEELIRALILSHLTAIYIKQSLGTLMGGDYERVCRSVKNMIANLTGMICDGAKPSCSLKICSGVSTALLSSLLSMEGRCVTAAEGIIDNDVDRSIHNLTSIGADAMRETDNMVLDIMTGKAAKD